jgi:hypothetical protein
MSDQIIQVCNICGAANLDNNQSWVRIFGATLGNSLNPITVIQRPIQGQFRPTQQRTFLDFCPNCAPKTTVDKIPGMYAAKSQPTK